MMKKESKFNKREGKEGGEKLKKIWKPVKC